MKILLPLLLILFSSACMVIPTPEHRIAGRVPCDEEKTTFIMKETTTQEEVLLKLGEPELVLNQERIFVYRWEMVAAYFIVGFEFPARGDLAPVTLTWYDGGLKPPRPPEFDDDDVFQDVLYIGDKGKLMGNRLIPESRMDTYKLPPKRLPRSPGHYQEWVNACRGGPPAGANFVDHAALVTEVCLLGNIAVRSQKKLQWDSTNFRFTNDPAANKLLHREYRSGWTL